MDAEWDTLIPYTPLVAKSQQFPLAAVLMVIGERSDRVMEIETATD